MGFLSGDRRRNGHNAYLNGTTSVRQTGPNKRGQSMIAYARSMAGSCWPRARVIPPRVAGRFAILSAGAEMPFGRTASRIWYAVIRPRSPIPPIGECLTHSFRFNRTCSDGRCRIEAKERVRLRTSQEAARSFDRYALQKTILSSRTDWRRIVDVTCCHDMPRVTMQAARTQNSSQEATGGGQKLTRYFILSNTCSFHLLVQ
jgi:hypothetical protein